MPPWMIEFVLPWAIQPGGAGCRPRGLLDTPCTSELTMPETGTPVDPEVFDVETDVDAHACAVREYRRGRDTIGE